MIVLKKNTVGLVILILFSQFARPESLRAGGGWTLNAGAFYFKLNQSFLSTNKIYNYDGSLLEINQTSLYISSLYAEYGVNSTFTGILYFPFRFTSKFGPLTLQPSGTHLSGDQISTFGDAQIGLKCAMLKSGPLAMSAKVVMGVPSGETQGGTSGKLQTGDGEFNQLLGVDLGFSLHPAPVWASAGMGFNNRTKGFSDEFHYWSELGVEVKRKANIICKTYGVKSFRNGFNNELEASNFSNDIEYLNVLLEGNLRLINKLWISASASYPALGRKALAAHTLSFGLVWDSTKDQD